MKLGVITRPFFNSTRATSTVKPDDKPEHKPDAAPAAAAPLVSDADWEAPVTADVRDEEALRVDLDGFSGPLDLLLALARMHKIDLTRISISALVEQYLVFIAEAKKLNLEVAGDYLVMAAWLAYLKSRLLLSKSSSTSPASPLHIQSC